MVRRVRYCRGCAQPFVTSHPSKQCCENCVGVPSSARRSRDVPTTSSGLAERVRMESALLVGGRNKENTTDSTTWSSTGSNDDYQQEAPLLAATLPDADQRQEPLDVQVETVISPKVTAKVTPSELLPPPVFDFYDDPLDVDGDDDDDDDQRLMDLACSDSGPAAAASGKELDERNESNSSNQLGQDADGNPVIDLLSSEEEEGCEHDYCINDDDEGENEPILPDFDLDPEDDDQRTAVDRICDSIMAPHPSDFQRQQDQLHAHASVLASADHPSSNNSGDDDACFICGVLLPPDRKRRLGHIKRCSKKHGVTARDIRYDDDHEHFAEHPFNGVERPTSSPVCNNPYLRRKKVWHGDAIQDLAAGGCVRASSSSTAAATTTTTTTCSTIQTDSKAELPSLHQMLLAGARRAAKTQHILKQQKKQQSNKRLRSGGWGGNTAAGSQKRHYSSCPSYKKIPGTDYCVDGFHYADPNLTKNYFLTHFHSDHYGGITKQWNAGVIYCSVSTANLVHQQLGVDRQYIHPLPMLTPTVLESQGKAVTVTLLNANHCPGAAMILFEIGKRAILHVGDFRWNYGIVGAQQAPLRPYCRIPWQSHTPGSSTTTNTTNTTIRRIDDLYLDTTYCDPKYALPSQAECIADVIRVAVDEVRRAQASQQRLLLLFGAYTIGKEMVYLAVAQQLGMKVYVDQRRFRILNALDCWTEEQRALFTTRPDETILWVVPLGHVNLKKLPSYQRIRMRGLQRDFDRVVGFRPTGWALGPPPANKGGGTGLPTTKDSVVRTVNRGNQFAVHSVPYSEHSSFPELVECLEVLNPRRIIPTVSVSKSQEQIDLLLKAWRDRQTERLLS